MEFDPNQLRFFSALLHERSVSRAALELRTAKGNVRRIWADLEKQLGEPLFTSEVPGKIQPTRAAHRLEKEMSGLLGEIRRFEDAVRKIHQAGRVLRLGADRHLFNTSHFGRLFATLRADPRFRIAFVEVESEDERIALESGACDLLFTEESPIGRRFEARDLPALPLDVACADPVEACDDFAPEGLAGIDWALAAFSSRGLAERTLDRLRRRGGGRGRLWKRQDFLRWAEVPEQTETRAVVCIRPNASERWSRVSFLPLRFDACYPLQVTWLKQHPYEFISAIVEQMDRAFGDSCHGSGSSQP